MMIRHSLAILTTALFYVAMAAAADDPWVEFDKKPQHNPTSPAPKTIAATGTFKLPDGYKVREVEIRIYKDGSESRARRTEKATIDEKAKTWTAKMERIEEDGEYWVDAVISAEGPDGQKYGFYTLDQRRVGVSGKKAP